MVRIPGFQCSGLDLFPGQGIEILQAERFGGKKNKGKRNGQIEMQVSTDCLYSQLEKEMATDSSILA